MPPTSPPSATVRQRCPTDWAAPTTYGYQYDSLYRLNSSLGAFTDANNDYYYNQLAMLFPSGNITQKDVTASLLIDGNVQSVNYQNAYTYNTPSSRIP
jgi:hypothetical protein